jgi:Fur family transcriptional regulator, ferric uptake regulator
VTIAPRRPPQLLRDLDEAAAVVRRAGGRLTAARRTVLEALLAAGGPVSGEHIASGLDGRVATTDPASVYRNLQWLEEQGVVRHVHVGHGPGLYALAGEHDREYLVCERCGSMTTLDAGALAGARAAIAEVAGFEAHFDHFPVHGLCGRCAPARGAAAR